MSSVTPPGNVGISSTISYTFPVNTFLGAEFSAVISPVSVVLLTAGVVSSASLA